MKDGNEHFFVMAPANTGLRDRAATPDGGVGDATLSAADLGSFKSPSLRNVEVTAPYGHDGRFATLEGLIDHYSHNAIVDPTIGYVVSRGLKFTLSEKAALIAFLKTLTDRTCLTDPRFSSPFGNRKDVERRIKPALPTTAAALMGVVATAAEAPAVLRLAVRAPEVPPLPPAPTAKPPQHPMIGRLMSFDVNANHRLSRDELPERMHGLIARGDRNADAALDSDEIRALVYAASSERAGAVVRAQPSEGLLGVVKDLRLAPAKHAEALGIVSAHDLPPTHVPAVSKFSGKMRALLDAEEYENFVAAAARVARRPHTSVKER
jgi:hypothetical protein